MEMYIGLREPKLYSDWIIDDEINISKQDIYYSKALYKIIDEIVVNAIDQYTRTQELTGSDICNIIKCKFNKETGEISIFNNGKGIQIIKFEDNDFYIPEMIFSQTMTGSNFNPNDEKITGGINGLGAKLTNYCSEYFIINTVSELSSQSYEQRFEDGNNIINPPKITKTKKKGSTEIIFKPDYALFYGDEPVDFEIIEKIIRTRIYYTSVFCTNAKVYFNDLIVKVDTLEKFAKLVIKEKKYLISTKLDNWDIVIGFTDLNSNQEQISIINGIIAKSGGSHIAKINKLILDNLKDKVVKLMKNKTNINTKVILNNLFIFMKGYVVNPKWGSQSKDELTVTVTQFKNYSFSDDIYVNIWKKLRPMISDLYINSEKKDLEKSNNTKSKSIRNEKLTDALWAGTAKSAQCKLILTEGNSAATFAITGLSVIGRDRYGVYPLKGKPLNVRGETSIKVTKNVEISDIQQILGLQYGCKYTDVKSLRYGGIIILTDADLDGSHISGLLLNLFHVFWPELIELDYIQSMSTPIIKANKGKEIVEFYTMKSYEDWVAVNPTGWDINYYKGLGTSTDAEIISLFKTFDKDIITYQKDVNTDDSMELGFNKKLANLRKDWLLKYNKNNVLTEKDKKINITDFINKDLIHFSHYDVIRSIPNLIDGLKITQRKVLYTGFEHIKDNSVKQKVAQFSARISEKTCYMHGEASVSGTIIKMAQTYMGSNNCNLLLPKGQFGSRLFSSGSDHASERYIYTNVNDVAFKLFRKEDSVLLKYIDFENQLIEPEYYIPILPTILINGALGIGTGFSTFIPTYNLEDIANIILKKLDKKRHTKDLIPYVRFFKGKIKYISDNKYIANGVYEFDDKNTQLIITELPPGIATKPYKAYLETLIIDKNNKSNSQFLLDVIDVSTKNVVNIKIKMKSDDYKSLKALTDEELLSKFNMTTNISESNMYLFDENNEIKKFKSPIEIINHHYKIRYDAYVARKEAQLIKLRNDMIIYRNKVNFINGIINNTIKIMNIKKIKLSEDLESKQFYKVNDSYDYLINMQISTLTKERVIKLEMDYNQRVADVKQLEALTIEDIWKSEIEECLLEYKKYNAILATENN